MSEGERYLRVRSRVLVASPSSTGAKAFFARFLFFSLQRRAPGIAHAPNRTAGNAQAEPMH